MGKKTDKLLASLRERWGGRKREGWEGENTLCKVLFGKKGEQQSQHQQQIKDEECIVQFWN